MIAAFFLFAIAAFVGTAAAVAKPSRSYGLSAGYAAVKGKPQAASSTMAAATVAPVSAVKATVTIQKSFPEKIAMISYGISEGYRRSKGVIMKNDAVFAAQAEPVLILSSTTAATVVVPAFAVSTKRTYGFSEGYKRAKVGLPPQPSASERKTNPLSALAKIRVFARAFASIQYFLRGLIGVITPLLVFKRTQ